MKTTFAIAVTFAFVLLSPASVESLSTEWQIVCAWLTRARNAKRFRYAAYTLPFKRHYKRNGLNKASLGIIRLGRLEYV